MVDLSQNDVQHRPNLNMAQVEEQNRLNEPPTSDLPAVSSKNEEQSSRKSQRMTSMVEGTQSLWEPFLMSIGLVGRMVPYSVFSLPVFAVYWYPRADLNVFEMTPHYWGADLANNATIVIDHSFTNDVAWKIWVFFTADAVFWGYFPVTFVFYCQFTKLQIVKIFVPLLVLYVLYDAVRSRFGYTVMTSGFTLLSMPIATLIMKQILPKDSRIPAHATIQFAVFVLGFIFIQVVNFIPAKGDYIQIVMICIVVPFVRELWMLLARHSSRYLTTDYEVGSAQNQSLSLRRERTWVFFLHVQITVATYVRLLFTRIEDDALMALVIISQAGLEIVMRVSTAARDRKLRDFMRKFRKERKESSFHSRKRRNTLVVVPVSETEAQQPGTIEGTKEEAKSDPTRKKSIYSSFQLKGNQRKVSTFGGETVVAKNEDQVEIAFKTFRAQIALGEMLSEYIGIICAPIIIYMYRNHPMAVTLDYYNLGNPFDHPIEVKSVFGWALSQFISEIAVDVVCTIFELRQGYPLARVWFGKHHRVFIASIFFSSWFAMISLNALLNQTDGFDKCIGTDMCCCSDGNGLRYGGIRQRYCERIYANTTNGFPDWICQQSF